MVVGLMLVSLMKVCYGWVNLCFGFDGLIKNLMVDVGCDGIVCGYVGELGLEFDLIQDEVGYFSFNFKEVVGIGYFYVMCDDGKGEFFNSIVEFVSGGIGEDVVFYLFYFEQIFLVVFVGEQVNSVGIYVSGGFLV